MDPQHSGRGLRTKRADQRRSLPTTLLRRVEQTLREALPWRPGQLKLGPASPGQPRSPSLSPADEDGLRSLPGGQVAETRISISVDGSRLRLVQTARRRVVGWGCVELPEGAISGGTMADSQILGTALDRVFSAKQLPRKRTRIAIPAVGSAMKVLPVPWLEDEELQQAVSDEATRLLGYSEADSYLWWQEVPGRRRDRRVFVLTCPREPVVVMIEACELARVELEDMDLGILSAARCANQRDAIVASVEGACVEAVAIANDLPVYARSVLASPPTREAAEDLLPAEISLCIAAVEEQRTAARDGVPPPIYLCGSAARSQALAERVRIRSGRRPSVIAPPLFVPSDLPAAEYAAALGMAIKEPQQD